MDQTAVMQHSHSLANACQRRLQLCRSKGCQLSWRHQAEAHTGAGALQELPAKIAPFHWQVVRLPCQDKAQLEGTPANGGLECRPLLACLHPMPGCRKSGATPRMLEFAFLPASLN